MKNAEFSILVEKRDEKTIVEAWNYWEDMNAIKKRFYGEGKADFAVEFINLKELIYGTGKGEEQKELKKIASGGEMSRIMLSIKNILRRSR